MKYRVLVSAAALAATLGLTITGNGLDVDFGNSSPAVVALDVKRTEFWTDVAATMGAPVIRVFAAPCRVTSASWGGKRW